MTIVKTRQVGNSISITIPKELGIETGQEYNVFKGSDGTLLFSPNTDDIFNKTTDDVIREKLIAELGKTIDRNLAAIEAGHYKTLGEIEERLFG